MEKKMKLVRLSSGEELICNVEETETTVIISNGFNMVSTEPGKIGFIPFMAYSKDKQFIIDKSHVLMICEPVDELIEQITKSTSTSNILMPKEQGIITQ